MKINQINYPLFSIVILSLFTKCATTSYYLNAFNGNHHYYHSIPLKSDSVTSAMYLSSTVSLGFANFHDRVKSITTNFHRSHSLGTVQAYYGANVSVGQYEVNKQRPNFYGTLDTVRINTFNQMTGRKIFGGYGLDGGLNIVVPIGRSGAEWRILGFETSLQEEFGSYLKFRRNIPDSVAQVNMKSSFFPTIGLTTEIMYRWHHLFTGYRIAIGTSLKKEDQNRISLSGFLKGQGTNPFYFVQTITYIYQNLTMYWQLNIASYSVFLQGGFNYNIHSKRQRK